MSKQDTDSIRINQVMAGALAAVTAALLGSTLGVAGTVLGAGLASVVSTVGAALYLRSIQRTGQGVRSVRERAVARAGTTAVAPAEQPPNEGRPGEAAARRPPPGRVGRPRLIVGSVLAFALGMVVVTGVEWLRGEPLSGGDGTTVGGIVRAHPDGADERDESPSPVTGDPSSTGDRTVTVTPTPTPTSATPEPSDPPSGSSTPPSTPSTPSSPQSGGGSSGPTAG